MNAKEKTLARALAWQKANPERRKEIRARWIAKNLEKMRTIRAAWKKNNPEKVRETKAANEATRRARKAMSAGKFTAAQIDGLYNLQRGRCASCKDRVGVKFHRDHILPLVLGGSNGIENIQLLCPSCNRAKGAKHPAAYAEHIGMLL